MRLLIVLHPQPLNAVGYARWSNKAGALKAPAADKYIAELPGGEHLPARRNAIYDSARTLSRRGMADETLLEFQHAGSSIVAARGIVGELRKWRVTESDVIGLHKRLWQPFPGRGSFAEEDSDDE